MTRHTTFKFCLDPTVEQQEVLLRHAGAARFAFNECLAMTKAAITQHRNDPDMHVPWTGFDLINAFNAWKLTEAAGRVFAVDSGGVAELVVTGLVWRDRVCQQVFEEAAVDCGRALAAWSDSRSGNRKGRRVGFPRFKKKDVGTPSFRLRNRQRKGQRPSIRLGDTHMRAVTLPVVGSVRVHDDAGSPKPADGKALTDAVRVSVKPARMTREPTFEPPQRPEPRTPEKGGVEYLALVRHALRLFGCVS